MTLLQSFGVMNSTAFAKITKKHDKHIRTRFTMRLAPLLKDMEFEKQTRLVPMISTAEVRIVAALSARKVFCAFSDVFLRLILSFPEGMIDIVVLMYC